MAQAYQVHKFVPHTRVTGTTVVFCLVMVGGLGHACLMLTAVATREAWPGVPSVHNLPSGRPQGVRVKGVGVAIQRKKGKGKGKHKAPGS